jgi:hypothetical protein
LRAGFDERHAIALPQGREIGLLRRNPRVLLLRSLIPLSCLAFRSFCSSRGESQLVFRSLDFLLRNGEFLIGSREFSGQSIDLRLEIRSRFALTTGEKRPCEGE